MTTIVPPLPGPPPAAGPVAPPVLTPAAGTLPAALAALPAGSQIDATVLPPQPGQARNLLELATAAGPLLLRSRGDLPLPPGTTLTLQVLGGDGLAGLRLVAVNGRTLLPGIAGMPGTPTLPGTAAAALAAPSPSLPLAGRAAPDGAAPPAGDGPAVAAAALGPAATPGLLATLLRPAPAPPAAASIPGGAVADAQPPALPPGTQFVVRIAGLTPPPAADTVPAPPAPAAAADATPGGVPTATSAAAHGDGAPSPAATTAPPPPGGIPAAPPDPLAPPGSLPPPGEAPPEALVGTVTAHTPGNQALVATPLGTLSLPAADQLPVGAGVTLDLVSPPLPPPAAAAPSSATEQGLGAAGWPALDAAAVTLAAAEDGAAMQQLVQILPQLGPQLAANLSLFANALRSGDVDVVFGDRAIRGLEKAGRRDLADQLKSDVKALADDTAQPVGNGAWTRFALPLISGAQIDPVYLFVRRPPGQDDEDGAGLRRGDEHRFLVEVALSRLGRVQLDGLVQRESKRFDLIIRTDQPLPAEMRHDILGLFAATGDAVGTKGSVTFQPGGRFVDLPPAPPPATSFSV